MNRNLLAGFILCWALVLPATSQDKIKQFTLSIVDTNSSEYEQAQAVYTWLTSNIVYDIKAFKGHEYTYTSAEEILDKRKGVCADYARLFAAMCNSVGIETYTIAAYSKGFGYYKGKPLVHTNHQINVFYANETWHFVDPTSGSGKVYSAGLAFGRMLNRLTGINALASHKLKYEKKPNADFFDISPEKLIKQQYPLDPKWLQSENTPSFIKFELDSLPLTQEYSNLDGAINAIRDKDEFQVLKLDAENGILFNSKNYFDLASGYSEVSKSYDIEREIKESNLWQFEKYRNDFDIILKSCDRASVISDSIYRARNKELKLLLSTNSRLSSKIKKQSKSAKKSIKPETKRILKKSDSYKRKMDKIDMKAAKFEGGYLNPVIMVDSMFIQNGRIMASWTDFKNLEKSNDTLRSSSDSVFSVLGSQTTNDAKTNDSIYVQNREFELLIRELDKYLSIPEEDSIKAYLKILVLAYGDMAASFAKKQIQKAEMQQSSKIYFANSSMLQANMTKQISLLRSIYAMGAYPDSIRLIHNAVLDTLVQSYKQSHNYLRKLNNHNLMQIDYKRQIVKSLKAQKKAVRVEARSFSSWYKAVAKWEEGCYVSDKLSLKQTKTHAQTGSRLVVSKLKKYNQANTKAN